MIDTSCPQSPSRAHPDIMAQPMARFMTRHRLILILILAAYLFLAVGFGAVTPLFEAPDENMHYFTVEYIAETDRLPQVGEQPDPLMAQEAAQPPLYYFLSSLIIRPFETSQAKSLVWVNPRAQLGDASALSNINVFVHGPSESWPWEDYVLYAHLLRLFSAFMGLGTLLFIYGSARLIWPEKPDLSLLAVALVAFLPQFSFLHGSISNDPLVIMLSAGTIWQLLRMWFRGNSWLALFFLGLTIGLAVLSKIAGLLLLLYALIFLTVLIWRPGGRSSWRPTLLRWALSLSLVALTALLISGWMFWRNWGLYGDPTAAEPFIRIAGGDRGYSLSQVLRETPSLLNSIISVFGWMNVRPAGWVFIFWKSLFFVGIVGAAYNLVKTNLKNRVQFSRLSADALNSPWILPALLFLWVAMVYIGLISFLLRTPAAQGRLLFPALLPLALILAYGLSIFRSTWLYIVIGLIAFSTALYSLFVVIPDAYKIPPVLTEEEIPAGANIVEFDLGQDLRLVAAQVETETAFPGEIVWLDLYWRLVGDRPTPVGRDSPEFVLELFGRDDELVGKVQGYHGGGLYPAALWSSAEIVPDRVGVRLITALTAPTRVRINLKLAGEDTAIEVGAVKVAPLTWPELSEDTLANLNGIQLVEVALESRSFQAGEVVPVNVQWQVINPPGMDLTTFIHLGNPQELPLSQGDSPPLGGDYPVSFWAAGEFINDSYILPIPADLSPGRYPLYIGMYDPVTGLRQPLSIDGKRQLNDAYLAGWITINN